MSDGITQSINFSTKLVKLLEDRFGAGVVEVAEKLVPRQERQAWLNDLDHHPIETYIKNMGFLVNFLQLLTEQYGDEIAKITSDLVIKEEKLRWKEVALHEQAHDIKNFIHLAWEPLKSLGFVYEANEKEDGMKIHCTYCPIHELSKILGGASAKWLAILECNKDLSNVKGFNTDIKIDRTKTLMKGDRYCNHYYRYKK